MLTTGYLACIHVHAYIKPFYIPMLIYKTQKKQIYESENVYICYVQNSYICILHMQSVIERNLDSRNFVLIIVYIYIETMVYSFHCPHMIRLLYTASKRPIPLEVLYI